MEEKKNNKLLIGILIGLLVGVLLTSIFFMITKKDKDNDVKENFEEKQEHKESGVRKEDIIIESFKDYYISNKLANKDNIKTWDISIKEEKDEYVVLDNTYTCNDNTSDCIYVEQENKDNNKYTFTIRVYGKYHDDSYSIDKITSNVETGNVVDNKTISEDDIKNYLTSKGFMKTSNIKTFNIFNIEYIGYFENRPESKYYMAKGTYSCVDGSSDCVYQEQVNDSVNGVYSFDQYIEVVNNEIVSISGPFVTSDMIK